MECFSWLLFCRFVAITGRIQNKLRGNTDLWIHGVEAFVFSLLSTRNVIYMLCLGNVFLDILSVLLRICPEAIQDLDMFSKELRHL